MKTLESIVGELSKLITEYKFNEALAKFYDEGVITVENEGSPVVGLEAYRISAKAYINNVSNYSARLKNVIVSDNLSVLEWHYTFDHKVWGHWDKTQLSVQRWKDGKIIHERHHYV